MSGSATSLASWTRVIRRTLDAAGCDGGALLRQAGLDAALLDDPHARIPVEQTTRLWRLAVEATGDPAFGLAVASQVTVNTFHALGHGLIASTTLKDAFERLLRYFRIATDAAELAFSQQGDTYVFEILPLPGVAPAPESTDAFLSTLVRMCRALSRSPRAEPLRIELRRPEPQPRTRFDAVLRAPLQFGAPATRLVYAREDMERPLDDASVDLARHHDALLARHLARVEQHNAVAQVKAVLIDLLPHGEPSQETVAGRLAMSTRTLQRRLGEQQTSFSALLDATRCELARIHMADPGYSVGEIAYLLGFSDTSGFTRAFRRWTGMSPTEFREGSRGAPAA